jgi:hypothetical protein
MSEDKKEEVITFKVNESLARVLKGIPNRSEFIRNAVLSALDNSCPLCKGVGTFTPDQWRHWEAFSREHPLEECNDCHSLHLVCRYEQEASKHEDGGLSHAQ